MSVSTSGSSKETAQKDLQRYTKALVEIAQLGRGKKRKQKSVPQSIPDGDWCRVSEYANREGITRQAAYLRVKRGAVEYVTFAGVMLVRKDKK
jgi:hypothetical protein